MKINVSHIQQVKNLLAALVRVFYPEDCVLCRCKLELAERVVCSHCSSKLEKLKPPLCKKCASELAPYGQDGGLCSSCRHTKTNYQGGSALFRYSSEIRTLLHLIKFRKKNWYLKAFRPYLRQMATPLPINQYDLIVPVPLDSRRIREREFNQSDELARLLVSGNQRTLVSSLLKKVRATKPQSSLHRRERLNNLDGAFALKRNQSVLGKNILIVDDIFTTGATVNECARCLKEHGAKRVDFFTLSRTLLPQ